MEISDPKKYCNFYKQKSLKLWKFEPLNNKTFKQQEMKLNLPQIYLNRLICLPMDRIFLIGGATDIQCTNTKWDTIELVQDGEERKMTPKANMWTKRAAFGVAVYPNSS